MITTDPCPKCGHTQEFKLKQGRTKLKPIKCKKCGHIVKKYTLVIYGAKLVE
jgi:predicted RNA-binding Zn-ribbon protein involved in translation (DUF1610 family)